MSWTVSIPAGPRNDFADRVDALQLPANGDEAPSQEAINQLDAAREALKAIADSGAVGNTLKHLGGYASGHANPGHEPLAGWSNDTISVSVTQITPPVAEEVTG